jgi:hypothetical protein
MVGIPAGAGASTPYLVRGQNSTLSNWVYSPKILVVFLSHFDKIWFTPLEIPVVATRNRAGH